MRVAMEPVDENMRLPVKATICRLNVAGSEYKVS